jgi:hypothetical protein
VKATTAPRLTLQLLPEPRRIAVTTKRRRDHLMPSAVPRQGVDDTLSRRPAPIAFQEG